MDLCFFIGFSMWALCGHCVGTVWALCGHCESTVVARITSLKDTNLPIAITNELVALSLFIQFFLRPGLVDSSLKPSDGVRKWNRTCCEFRCLRARCVVGMSKALLSIIMSRPSRKYLGVLLHMSLNLPPSDFERKNWQSKPTYSRKRKTCYQETWRSGHRIEADTYATK